MRLPVFYAACLLYNILVGSMSHKFEEDFKSFLARPAPTANVIDSDEFESDAKFDRNKFNDETEDTGVHGESKFEEKNHICDAKSSKLSNEYCLLHYDLYEEYCSIFESSICEVVASREAQTDLVSLLKKAVEVLQATGTDDTMASVFLDMIDAMSNFEEFYSMMHEAYCIAHS